MISWPRSARARRINCALLIFHLKQACSMSADGTAAILNWLAPGTSAKTTTMGHGLQLRCRPQQLCRLEPENISTIPSLIEVVAARFNLLANLMTRNHVQLGASQV